MLSALARERKVCFVHVCLCLLYAIFEPAAWPVNIWVVAGGLAMALQQLPVVNLLQG